ncbi:MAG: DUF4838 domain-containing protein [Planctomycetota bacterium]|nr:DUF4838 domain-containing protein [Planctomycetota bacterium]
MSRSSAVASPAHLVQLALALVASAAACPLPASAQATGGQDLPARAEAPEVQGATEVFVAPDAAPGGDGSAERPLASIEAARDLLRASGALPWDGDGPRPILQLLPGTFELERGLVLDERDRGLLLTSEPVGATRLIGGRRLDAAEARALDPARDAAWLARLPTDAARAAVRGLDLPHGLALVGPGQRGVGSAGGPVRSEVFVNGQALTPARWPNDGFAKLGEVLDTGSIPRNRAADIPAAERETDPDRGGVFRPQGVSRERLARWASADEPWAMGYWFHDWADEQLPIAKVDVAAGSIQLAGPHRYGLKAGTSFYVTNLIEELDQPGEYHLDRAARQLFVWLPEGEDASSAGRSDSAEGGDAGGSNEAHPPELILSSLAEPLLSIEASRGIEVSGLHLGATRGAALVATDCDGVRVESCVVQNTGTDGIRLRGTNNGVYRCDLADIGATGVNLNGGDRASLMPGNNVLSQSRIRYFGRLYRTYQPAAQLGGVGQQVLGNELGHAPHSAIIFGGNEHLIEGNEIFDVLRETGDSGAIYCGRDWTMHGTRIAANFIHHLGGTDGRWQNAIYLDDMASGIEVTDNLIWRAHWGMLVGGGRDLDIHGNTFIECDLGIRFDARGVGWMAKHIADPATSTLHKRLFAMPIESEPWASRYPSLQHYLTDRFGRPAGSRLADNTFIATKLGPVDDRGCVEVTGTVELSERPAWLDPSSFVEAGPRLGERASGSAVLGADLASQRIQRTSEQLTWVPGSGYPSRRLPTLATYAILERARAAELLPDQLTLAAYAASDWTIVLRSQPSETERAAANIFRFMLLLTTGAEVPIAREPFAGPRRILIGDTTAGLAYATSRGIDRDALGEDGFAIFAQDHDLVLLAGAEEDGPTAARGIFNAVTELSEEQLDVRFWAPGAMQLFNKPIAQVPTDLLIVQAPPIWFRQVNYGPANEPDYRDWHKLDRVQDEVGRLWAPRWVHSFFHHVDPAEHFEAHPEYFSLVGDRRTPSQLCLTNEDVFDAVVASFERTFAEHPGVQYISFSQEDNYDACTCGPCAAIDAAEGTQMGSLLTFVNRLAERFPDRIVSTLAYQYSRKPPANLRPRENVSIMLCTIEEDRARPIATNPTSSFPADLAGWSAISDDIFLWDYEVQFASPVAPFPNLRTLGPNVRWFADAGVKHVFLQGNGERTEFAELRCYLLAKLAWDPSTDVEATIDEFLAGFYGPAAPHLGAYIDLLHDELEASGDELVLYGNPAQAAQTWLRDEVREQAWQHLDAAVAAAELDVRATTPDWALAQGLGKPRAALGKRDQDPLRFDEGELDPLRNADRRLERVRTACLPLMYAELEIAKRRGARPGGIWEWVELGTASPDGADAGPDDPGAREPGARRELRPRPEIAALVDEFLAGCAAVGIPKLREYDLTLDRYRADWDALLDPALPNHRALGAPLTATPAPSTKYAGGDVSRLVDGLPGARPGSAPVTRAYGENWVGWEGTDASLVLDLGPSRDSAATGTAGLAPTQLSFSALQEPRSWVWLPHSITVEARIPAPREADAAGGASAPPETWILLGTLTHQVDERTNEAHRFDIALPTDRPIRALRLTVDALETCPAWHLGAGGPAWFFLDELRVD